MLELGTLDRGILSVIAEDSIAFDTPFWGRFGLSMLLELGTDDSAAQLLYDTNSAAPPILHNLNILGKSLGEIQTIFLSHCHYDHTDGLAGILDALGRPISVVAHPEIFRPCFEKNPDGIRQIGMLANGRSELEHKGAVFTLTGHPLKLMTGAATSGEIERLTAFETLEELYTTINGSVVQDHERDDMALILNFPEGLVIVTGCCHAGIVNTMEHAKKITGVDKIHAVIGGLHFIDASNEKVNRSIEALQAVDWIFAGHCTGVDGIRRLADGLGERLAVFHTGSVIHLPVKDDAHRIDTIPTAVRDRHRFS
jgi:7,8-dihydropterin-6-yl-methyl-4-(beta-D-ribofuranosyl)aminobenzene 5'-phosphate synthase